MTCSQQQPDRAGSDCSCNKRNVLSLFHSKIFIGYSIVTRQHIKLTVSAQSSTRKGRDRMSAHQPAERINRPAMDRAVNSRK